MTPVTKAGAKDGWAPARMYTANPTAARTTVPRIANAAVTAVSAVTGSQSLFPIRASAVDSDSYCGSKESPSTA